MRDPDTHIRIKLGDVDSQIGPKGAINAMIACKFTPQAIELRPLKYMSQIEEKLEQGYAVFETTRYSGMNHKIYYGAIGEQYIRGFMNKIRKVANNA